MTRYVRNLGGMLPLPPWLRLWLQEKNEKERAVAYLLDVQSSRQKAHNNARQPGTAKLRQTAILSVLDATFGCYQLDQWFSNCGTRTTSGMQRPSR